MTLPGMAVSGSLGQDVRCFRLVRFYRIIHFISEIRLEAPAENQPPVPFHLYRLPLASLFRDVYKVCIHLRLSRFTNNIPKTG